MPSLQHVRQQDIGEVNSPPLYFYHRTLYISVIAAHICLAFEGEDWDSSGLDLKKVAVILIVAFLVLAGAVIVVSGGGGKATTTTPTSTATTRQTLQIDLASIPSGDTCKPIYPPSLPSNSTWTWTCDITNSNMTATFVASNPTGQHYCIGVQYNSPPIITLSPSTCGPDLVSLPANTPSEQVSVKIYDSPATIEFTLYIFNA